jgi:hypothetical protein
VEAWGQIEFEAVKVPFHQKLRLSAPAAARWKLNTPCDFRKPPGKRCFGGAPSVFEPEFRSGSGWAHGLHNCNILAVTVQAARGDLYALAHGASEEEIRAAIASRDLSKQALSTGKVPISSGQSRFALPASPPGTTTVFY